MKTPIILQHDERDCGAACLSMIATYYGLKQPISKYRELTKTERKGTNLYGLKNGAQQLGLEAEVLSGTAEDFENGLKNGEITFPLIAHIVSDEGMLHYVVIYGIRDRYFVVADPAKGRKKVSFEYFFEQWTGYIVTFKKTDKFTSGNYTKGGFRRFFQLLKGQYIKLAGVFILSLAISAIGIMGAFVFEIIIDNFATDTGYYEETAEHSHEEDTEVEENREHTHEKKNILLRILKQIVDFAENSNFSIIFVSLIFLYILQALIQFVRGKLIISLSKQIDIRLALTYYNHIIDLPISAVSVRQTGEYLSRFSDTASIRTAISGATITLLLDSIMVIACGIILYMESARLFAVSLLIVVLYVAVLAVFKKPIERSNRQAMENNAVLQSYFKESIDGVETVKATCANTEVKETTTIKFGRFVDAVVRNNTISLSQDVLTDMIELVGTAVVLWIGFAMVLSSQITIGSLMTCYVLLSFFTQPIKNLIELQPTVQTALVAADRLNDILDLRCEEPTNDGQAMPEMEIESIEFNNVDFRYGNRELTLENFNLSFQKGEKIAIVGESGSGKTTLAKLLLRFYEPEQGSILLNGKDIRSVALSALRKEIAYVDQNTFLFADTIKNNLRLGNAQATDAALEEVCRISRADEFINRLPLGYDTLLDENGTNLSGGQRQRLAIARALLRKPRLLILDEATSNLDTITEASIKSTIDQINGDMSCIIIAHRLTTVKSCDRIYVMDQGKIVEFGTHEALLEKGGKYTALWNMQ